MEQNFADLLNDAFSESSVPSFSDGALDFENVNFDEKFDEDEVVNQETLEEDGALRQEANNHNVVLETSDMSEDEDEDEDEDVDEDEDEDEDVDADDDDDEDEDEDEIVVEDEDLCGAKGTEENFPSVQFSPMNVDGASQEDYASSGEELEQIECVSGEDEEVEEEDTGTRGRPGDLLKSVHCRDEFRAGNKEDRIFAEGRPPAPEGPEKPEVRNQEQGENESEEEVSYFGNVPEIYDDGNEKEEEEEEEVENREENRAERQEDSSDSESEGMKIEAETFLCHSLGDRPTKASLEFPEISEQNLQDLIAEVDTEEHVEKMKDFSGEEHQEAGESFADYPSDFSSCEYVEEGGKNEEGVHRARLDLTSENNSEAKHALTWMGSDEEEDEGYLYSRDLEMDVDTLMSLDLPAMERSREVEDEEPTKECDDEDEGSESNSYSSSDDEERVRRSDDESLGGLCFQIPENNKQQDDNKLQSWTTEAFSSWSTSDDYRPDPAPFTINWEIDVSRTRTSQSENPDQPQTLPSDGTPFEGVSTNSYSEIQRVEAKTTGSSSNHGSLDDGFFFTEPDALETSESGQLGDDEYEEERSWEQEKERIDAFYKFYNDSDSENGREERQIKVQFCTDPLLQVIHYDSESSDMDSFSSSSEVEEDLSYVEPPEERQDVEVFPPVVQSACESPESNPAEFTEKEAELSSDTHIPTRKNKCLHILKGILKMSLVVLMGLLMFWFLTDQVDPVSIFKA